MRERVTHIVGKKPIILVAPHGADDTNTDIITEQAAKALNCYAVINRGFERADVADVDKDIADCNRIDHVKQEVIFDEFLKPIVKFANKLKNRSLATLTSTMAGNNWMNSIWAEDDPVYIFHIHGCGNHVHKEAGEEVEVVVGYGLGTKKDSLSCEMWQKDLFVDLWRKMAQSGEVYEGKGGGRYAGRDSNNMNQYFRKHDDIESVHSMQLEFPFSTRDNSSKAVTTAMMLTVVLDDFLLHNDYDKKAKPKFI